jgi:hypothetical protein
MDGHDVNRRLAAIELDVNALVIDPEWGPEDRDAATETWDRIDRIIGNLRILLRDQGLALARRTDDEHTAVTANGAVTIHRHVESSEKWDGWSVLQALAEEVIDRDGELIGAVRLDTLQEVLPAVGQGQTSSKWKMGGLAKILPNAKDYRKVDYGAALIARGPLPRALRNRKPAATSE